jgi:hypothetical protein
MLAQPSCFVEKLAETAATVPAERPFGLPEWHSTAIDSSTFHAIGGFMLPIAQLG